MHPSLRTSALVIPLASILLFVAPFSIVQHVSYALDQRPELAILFIGNSRTSANDMPGMVREIANSAGHTSKLRVEMHAPSDESMTRHAANPRVRELLGQGWDHVVLQAQSTELIDRQNWGKWLQPARELIVLARNQGSSPAMFVTWRYTDQCSDDRKWSAAENAAMHTAIQEQHFSLARSTGVGLVNVGLVWESVAGQEQEFSLYTDCNHPSVYGSYLSALMFYGTLLGGDVSTVTYTPDGILPHHAERLRSAVSSHLGKNAGSRASAVSEEVVTPAAERIAGVCILGLLIESQGSGSYCPTDEPEFEAAVDNAIPVVEAALVSAGQITPERIAEHRKGAASFWEEQSADPQTLDQLCQSVSMMADIMTPTYLSELSARIAAADPSMFTKDCI